jgi:hypothetical protein
MCIKNIIGFLPIFAMVLGPWVITTSVYARDGSLKPQLLDYAGKSYTGTQDPSYLNYDLALRGYLVDRISKQFGVALDPKKYSGFDLLEIEALFKCKKMDEPLDILLKMFPKHP